MTAPGAGGNEVRIKITADDDTERTRRQTEEKYKRQPPLKIPTQAEDPINAAWRRQVGASVRSLAKDVLKIPATADTEELRTKLAGSLAELRDISKIPVDLDLPEAAKFRADVDARTEAVKAQIKVELAIAADKAKLREEVAAAVHGATTGVGNAPPIELDVDTSKAEKKVRDASTGMGGLLVAGIAAAAPVAGAALASGVGLGMAAAVALVDKGNRQVQDSFKSLRTEVTGELHGIASGTQTEVVTALEQARAQAKMLGPDLDEAFVLGAKNIPTIESGIGQLVHNLMPGLLDEVRNSGPVMQGLQGFLADVGTTGSNVFEELSGHSDEFKQDLGEAGAVVTRIGDLVGKIVSGMSAGFGTTTSTLLGMVSALDAVGGPLGTVAGFTPDILLGAKAYGLAASGADALSGKLSGLAGKITGTGRVATGLRSGIQGLAGAVGSGGPLAAGIGVAEYWLTVLGKAEQDAAKEARDHASAVDETAAVLEQYGSATSAAAVHTEAAFLQQQDWVKTLESTGVGLDTITRAALGNKSAMDQVAGSQSTVNSVQGLAGGIMGDLTLGLSKQGKHAYDVDVAMSTLNHTYQDAVHDAQQLAGVTSGLSSTQVTASSNSSQLAADMLVLKDNTAGADDKIKALQDDLAILADHGMEKADDFASGFYDTLQGLVDELGNAKGPILDSSGDLDVMSSRGRDVLKALEGARDNMVGYAQSAADAGAPLATVNNGLQGQYNALLKTLEKMGLSKTAAARLLDQYKLLPHDITTNVRANDGQALNAIRTVQDAINAMHGRTVPLRAVADTGPAEGAMESLVGRWNGRTVIIRANVQEHTIDLGNSSGFAAGGPTSVTSAGAVGTMAGRGLTRIDEYGPEIVSLPTGSQVFPAANTPSMLRNAAGPTEVKVILEVAPGGNTAVGTMIKELARTGVLNFRTSDGKKVLVG